MERAAPVGFLNVLGGVSCTLPDGTLIPLGGRRTRELTAALALGGGEPQARDYFSGKLWPDCSPGSARKALNTELWRLRRTLRAAGTDPDRWITQQTDTLALVRDGGPEVDLDVFQSLADAPNLPEIAQGTDLMRRFGGPFAEGLDADWIDEERRRLHSQFTGVARRAAEAWQAANRLSDAMALAEALVRDDPLDEVARRMLLQLHIQSGNHGHAQREYADLEAVLQAELGVAPSPRTQAIVAFDVPAPEPLFHVEAPEPRRYGFEEAPARYSIDTDDPGADLACRVSRMRDAAEAIMSELAAIEDLLVDL